MKGLVIIGGGTFNPIRTHLSLASPAFGRTAKRLHEMLGGTLVLTKMANSSSSIKSNEDLSDFVDNYLIKDTTVKSIVFSAAVCDFECTIDNVPGSFNGERLKTDHGAIGVVLLPADKIIAKIRKERPDIFLVGFKATTNLELEEQFLTALKMMKATKCNLVLANDTITRMNMIITPEESAYCITGNRDKVLEELAEFVKLRSNLTYTKTNFIQAESYSASKLHPNFSEVLSFVIDADGFIENNGNGFTPGHFAQVVGKNCFASSQRKADHNEVYDEGLTLVIDSPSQITAIGNRKPSVGAKSQAIMFRQNPGYDCIIHTHNPLKEGSKIPVVEQKPYQCGSMECGLNTANNLQEFNGIKAVFLEKHGVNILFKSIDDPEKIITFIKENVKLGEKIAL